MISGFILEPHRYILPRSSKNSLDNMRFVAQAREGWPHAIERAMRAERLNQELLETLERLSETGKKPIDDREIQKGVMQSRTLNKELAKLLRDAISIIAKLTNNLKCEQFYWNASLKNAEDLIIIIDNFLNAFPDLLEE